MKYLVIFIVATVNVYAMDFCKFKVDGLGENTIQIDGKYRAKFTEQCIDATGGYKCYVYKNKAYEYIFVWVDDEYVVTVSNIYGKKETCRY